MSELLAGMKRSGKCTEFSENDIGREVNLMGWVDTIRNLGGVLFVDLRDVSGIMQVVFRSEINLEIFQKAEHLRGEFIIAVKGKIIKREQETINPSLKTGYIEIQPNELRILSKAETPPIDMKKDSKTNELMRLKYRYLDLRRKKLQDNLILRHNTEKLARDFFAEKGFLDITTPIMTKSTPEGARDYLVPSRVNKGKFFALPQSPQIFKQLLMVSGFDRYMQIARCFRDEDLRADRQPEFTQIDLEMSFVEEDDIMEINEQFIQKLMKEIKGIDIKLPIKKITYAEAMANYGSDKPDVRFDLKLIDLSDILKDSGFKVFSGAIEKGGSVRAINAKGCGEKFSRREIDALVEYVKDFGAKGMAWISVEEDGLKSAITKFLTQDELDLIISKTCAEPGDLICFVADDNKIVFNSLGALRLELAKKLDLLKDNKEFQFTWVTQFPLFEYDEDEKRWSSTHHPFTAPMDEDIEKLEDNPGKVRAKAYDLILNGVELGGGSIRIHSRDIQEKVFSLLGFTKKEAEERFGFLLNAFAYGVPPHGGIAYGLDRMVMLLAGEKSIRDVIAFPKIQNSSCPLTEAPSVVDSKQLEDLAIKIDEENL